MFAEAEYVQADLIRQLDLLDEVTQTLRRGDPLPGGSIFRQLTKCIDTIAANGNRYISRVRECIEGREGAESRPEQLLDQGIGRAAGQPPCDGPVAEIDGECAVLRRLFGNMYHELST
jgi:hypothetical protein